MAGSTLGRSAGGALRVGACQTPEILGDIDAAMACIEDFARRGDECGVQLLLFPECFLQGYLSDRAHVTRHALAFNSLSFDAVLRRLATVEQTLVFGVIEEHDGRYFNTAAVAAGGRLIGSYRKTRLMSGEAVFTPGNDYPTFRLGKATYGINICSDTQTSEPAAKVAAQGARLLLVPAQNMMRHEAAIRWKDQHHALRAKRAQETGMWLASSDVTGARGESRIAYGPTSVISPHGDIVTQVPLMTTGMAVADIPATTDR